MTEEIAKLDLGGHHVPTRPEKRLTGAEIICKI